MAPEANTRSAINHWRRHMLLHEQGSDEWMLLLWLIDRAQRAYKRQTGKYHPNSDGKTITIWSFPRTQQ